MTGRNYDYILTLQDVSGFEETSVVLGAETGTIGIIANVNHQDNTLKVKVDNSTQEYSVGETLNSNVAVLRSSLRSDIRLAPFIPTSFDSEVTIATSTITDITRSTYIAEKNSFHQNPLVRLYTLYYPGEWYPANLSGNPTMEGEGLSWPAGFPFHFAEVRGDIISDLQYGVEFGEETYIPYPIDSSGISVDGDGKIGEITLTVSNFDNLITDLIENPNLVGNNISNSTSAMVNGELVHNIDPRTVPDHSLFDQSVVDFRGGTNLAFDYTSTQDVNGEWSKLKLDTRDLLGGVVEIRTTFANFLDYWPEYSSTKSVLGNSVEVVTSLPYRPNDVITNKKITANIKSIVGNFLITDTEHVSNNITVGDSIYIVNPDADPENFSLDTFKIDTLDGLDEKVASFKLTSWLQHFRLQLPKRRFLKNTCPWVYKGEECQYPANGRGAIPGAAILQVDEEANTITPPGSGTFISPEFFGQFLSGFIANVINAQSTANGFFNIQNEPVKDVKDDVCAKNFTACKLRRNTIHYGSFIGTGATLPR